MARHWFGHGTVKEWGTKQTNAADVTVHAQAIAPDNGTYEVLLVIGGSVAIVWNVQHRDAPNTATLATQALQSVAGQHGEYRLWVELSKNERIRILNDGVIAGTSSAGVMLMKMK